MIPLAGRVVFVLAVNALLVGLPIAMFLALALRNSAGTSPRLRYLACVAAFLVVAGAPTSLLLIDRVARLFAGPSVDAATESGFDRLLAGGWVPPQAFVALAALWLVVALAGIAREARATVSLARLRATWEPLDGRTRRALEVPPGVEAWTGTHGSPMSLPSPRGSIYLPSSLVRELPLPALRIIAAHELDHARWRDPLVLAALRFVRALSWFSPGLAWIAALAAREREAAADAAALRRTANGSGERCDYARLLVDLVARGQGPKRSAITALEDGLETRVQRLLRPPGGTSGLATAAAGLLATLALGTPLWIPHAYLPPGPDARLTDSKRVVIRDVDRNVIRRVDRIVIRR